MRPPTSARFSRRAASDPSTKARRPPRRRPLARHRGGPSLDDLASEAKRAVRQVGVSSLEVTWSGLGYLDSTTPGLTVVPLRPTTSVIADQFGPRIEELLAPVTKPLLTHSLPVDTAVIDIAVCLDVLHRSPAPMELMVELARILRDGGRLYLQTPLVLGRQAQRPDLWHKRLGLNALLDGCDLALDDLARLRDSSGYGVVATKSNAD